MKNTSQLTCTRPYEWFEIHRHGSVFLCCPAWLKRPIGNLLEKPLSNIWNSPTARELRKSVKNGSFHNCSKSRCPFLLAHRQPVQQLNKIAKAEIREALAAPTSELSYSPQKLNLCFDLRCNLACPSCRQHHLIMNPQEQLQIEKITAIVKEQLLPFATEVTMSGFGDPFVSPAYLEILASLNAQGAEGAKLRLHSNGQLWTEQRWQQFNNLHQRVSAAEISVDAATAATYQSNRPGGSFEKLLINLKYLARQPFRLTLSMVVQNNNFIEIPRFVELAASLNTGVYLSQLVNWGTFTKTDFLARAVHLPGHPRHYELTHILRQVEHLPGVDIGNLQPLILPSS